MSDTQPTVTTDKLDYQPGDTAVFTVSSIGLGDAVELSVAHLQAGADGILGTEDDELSHDLAGTTEPWSVTDGGAGDRDGLRNGSIVT